MAAPTQGADSQVWNEVDVTAPLARNLSVTALGVVRDGDAVPDPALAGAGVTADYRKGPWTITLGDLWVSARNSATGHARRIDVPVAAVAYGWSAAGLAFRDRSRVERLDGSVGDTWRYRNQFEMEAPTPELRPIGALFFSDEGFYDLSRSQWTRNRAQAGVSVPMARRTELQVYFMRQDDRYARPGRLNILGFSFKIRLG